MRIFKTYGADAIRVISENPYRLARDIRGIGFKSADLIAGKLGIEKTAMVRARAGVGYALTEAMDEGHCGLPREQLLTMAATLLEVPAAIIEGALEMELQDAEVVTDTVDERPCIFLAGLHRAERAIAGRVRTLASGSLPWPAIDAEKAIPWVEGKAGVTLAESQREVVRLALRSKVLVITGGPGVGQDHAGRFDPEDPEGQGRQRRWPRRPAERRSGCRRAPASGRRRSIGSWKPIPYMAASGAGRITRWTATCSWSTETSMIDVPLMHALLKAVPDHASLILVGDVDQLPSVGPGQVLADIIGSDAVPVVRLTEVFRQAAASRIIVNAHRINRGLMPEWVQNPASDFHFVECADAEDGAAKILQIVRERIPGRYGLDPIRDIQVLCPMNRGGLGARSLNLDLQQALNPPGELRVERFGSTYGIGDKVMQVENDYDKEVYNGDLGVVRAIDPEASEMVIEFDGRPVTFGFRELDEIVLANATTIHKSQGSEYPAVVIPLTTHHAAAEPALHRGHTR